MKHCVYIHQNKLNLKVYVGYTCNTKKRWKEARYEATHPGRPTYEYPFSKAVRKYGWDGFTHQVIEEFDTQEEALSAEKFWIEFFRSNVCVYGRKYGYNQHEGGGELPKKQTRFSRDEEETICCQYKDSSSDKLGKQYGCSPQTILNILDRHGYTVNSDAWSPEKESKICKEYLARNSSESLAKQYECSPSRILAILKRHKIPMNALFSAQNESDICKEYETGISTTKLANDYDCDPGSIRRVLSRKGIKLRSRKKNKIDALPVCNNTTL